MLATGYMLLLSALFVLTPGVFLAPMLAEVEDPAGLEATAIVLLRFVALYGLFDSCTVVFVSALQGAGDTRFILWISALLSTLLVVATWITLNVFELRLLAAWTVITCWICAMGLAFAARFVQGKWRQMRVIEESLLPDVGESEPEERPPARTVAAASCRS